MSQASNAGHTGEHAPVARRRSLLDLAPLELDCMNTLWPLGEASVRDIREHLAPRRPRAYTTIMTIMDRLARKGIVARRKVGRAYLYRPHLTRDAARAQAIGKVLESFFEGSREALMAQLARPGELAGNTAPPRTAASPEPAPISASRETAPGPPRREEKISAPAPETRMDDTLL